MAPFKVGDKCQYNKKHIPTEVVEIVKIVDEYCLIVFPSGDVLCTKLSTLYPITTNP